MATTQKSSSPTASACLVGGRLLLLLTMILVLVMPLTEYLWHFDQFMRGGQDFEFGLLSMMTFLCLILVLLQHGRLSISCLMGLRRWLVVIFRQADPGAPGSLLGLITPSHAVPLPSAALRLYNLPLQI